jgi:dihydrofolate reductase
MTKVTAQMSVSLDGCYAGPLHDDAKHDDAKHDDAKHDDAKNWMSSAEAAGFFRITRWVIDAMSWRERQGYAGGEDSTNSDIVAETFEAAGAYVMGRRMADGGEVPWGEEPPFRAPVFVVTNRPRETLVRKGGTSFTYVTDGVASAIEQARAAANGRNVAVAGGGRLLQSVLRAGLLDELDLHIVPVVLGTGMRLLDERLELADKEGLELTPTRVIHTPEVTHLRYTVNGRAPLVLDDRGSGDGPARLRDAK